MADFDLSGYNTVAERITEFREKHPEGSLRPVDPAHPFTVIEAGGKTFVAYTAAAYRTPDDLLPGIGTAWYAVPGPTKFTRNSELQNAETAAWGRAIVAVGAADAKKGIASAEDVQSSQAEEAYYSSPEYAAQQAPTPGFRSSLMAATENLTEAERGLLRDWLKEEGLPDRPSKMNADQADRVCEWILHGLPKAEDAPADRDKDTGE